MTYDEAITKTQEDEQNEKIRKKARRHLMRKIYRDVCRKIYCKYCIAYESCRFRVDKTRVNYEYALFNMEDENIVKVAEWLDDEKDEAT